MTARGGRGDMVRPFDVNALEALFGRQAGHLSRFDQRHTEMSEYLAGKPVHPLQRPVWMDETQVAPGNPPKVGNGEVQYAPEDLGADAYLPSIQALKHMFYALYRHWYPITDLGLAKP